MTKKKREHIYWAAMLEITVWGLYNAGLCMAIWEVTDSQDVYFEMERIFPELYKQAPEGWNGKGYWFPAGECKKERLECLSRAIDLCNK